LKRKTHILKSRECLAFSAVTCKQVTVFDSPSWTRKFDVSASRASFSDCFRLFPADESLKNTTSSAFTRVFLRFPALSHRQIRHK